MASERISFLESLCEMNDTKDGKWIEDQKKAFTTWTNLKLAECEMQIYDLQKEFNDGIALYLLVCYLTKTTPSKYDKTPKHKLAKISNLLLTFKLLQQESVKIVNISSEDIHDGNLKLILGLVWTLIQHYQIGQLCLDNDTDKKTKKITKSDMDIIKNYIVSKIKIDKQEKLVFPEDLRDGILLTKIVEHIVPGSIPNFNQLEVNDPVKNVEVAFDTAEKYLAVPKMIQASELVHGKPDDKVLMTYLSLLLTAKPVKLPSIIVQKKVTITVETPEEISNTPTNALDIDVVVPTSAPTSIDLTSQVDKNQNELPSTPSIIINDDSIPSSDITIFQHESTQLPQEIEDSENIKSFNVVNLLSQEPIIKSQGTYLLIDLNGSDLDSADALKFKFNQDKSHRSYLLQQSQVTVSNKGIAEIKLCDLHVGDYMVYILQGDQLVGKLSKPIKIVKEIIKNIITVVLTEYLCEGVPISFICDSSNNLENKLDSYIDGPTSHQLHIIHFSPHLSFCTFIPESDGIYSICYKNELAPINNSSVSINVSSLPAQKPSLYPIFSTPYQQNLFAKLFIPYSIDFEHPGICFKKLNIDQDHSVHLEIAEHDFCQTIIDNVTVVDDKIKFQCISESCGFFVISGYIKKQNLKFHFLPEVVVVKSNCLYYDMKNQLYVLSPEKEQSLQILGDKKGYQLLYSVKAHENLYHQPVNLYEYLPVQRENSTVIFKKASDDIASYSFDSKVIPEHYLRGEAFEVFVTQLDLHPKDNFSVFVEDPYLDQIKFNTYCLGEKVYLNFTPQHSGVYKIKTYVLQKPQPNSPIRVYIAPHSREMAFIKNIHYVKLEESCDPELSVSCLDSNSNIFEELPYKIITSPNDFPTVEIVSQVFQAGYVQFRISDKEKQLKTSNAVQRIAALPKYECLLGVRNTISVPRDYFICTYIPTKLTFYAVISNSLLNLHQEILIETEISQRCGTVNLTFTPHVAGLLSIQLRENNYIWLRNPIQVYVRPKPYVKMSDAQDDKNNFCDSVFLKLSEISDLDYYATNNIPGLSAIISSINGKDIDTAIYEDDTGSLGFYVNNNNLNEQVYQLTLCKDGLPILGSKTDLHVKFCDNEEAIRSVDTLDGDCDDSQQKAAALDTVSQNDGVITLNLKKPAAKLIKVLICDFDTNFSHDDEFIVKDYLSNECESNKICGQENIALVEFSAFDSGMYDIYNKSYLENPYKIKVCADEIDDNSETSIAVINEPHEIKLNLGFDEQLKEPIMSTLFQYHIVALHDNIQTELNLADLKYDYSGHVCVTFTPNVLGDYDIALVNKDAKKFAAVAKSCTCVSKEERDSLNISARGRGLELAYVKEKNTFTILGKDFRDKKLLRVYSSDRSLVFTVRSKLRRGVRVSYIPDSVGNLQIQCEYDGKPILKQPAVVSCRYRNQVVLKQRLISCVYVEVEVPINFNLLELKRQITYQVEDYYNKNCYTPCVEILDYDSSLNVTYLKVGFYPLNPGKHTLELFYEAENTDSCYVGPQHFYVDSWTSIPEDFLVMTGNTVQYFTDTDYSIKVLSREKDESTFNFYLKGEGHFNISSSKISEKLWNFTWNATCGGKYMIHLSNSKKGYLKGFPKKVNVFTQKISEINHVATDFILSGLSFDSLTASVPNFFKVMSQRLNTDEISVSINGKKNILFTKEHKCIEGFNFINIGFVPSEAEMITIELIYKGQHLKGSPFKIPALTGYAALSSILTSLHKKFKIYRNSYTEFIIDASSIRKPDINIKIVSDDYEEHIFYTIEQIVPGLYAVIFRASDSKEYRISITNGGYHISGSPFRLKSY